VRGLGEGARGRGGEGVLLKPGDSYDWPMAQQISSFRDLRVYQQAMKAAMQIFEMTKGFPPEERYSMVDQVR